MSITVTEPLLPVVTETLLSNATEQSTPTVTETILPQVTQTLTAAPLRESFILDNPSSSDFLQIKETIDKNSNGNTLVDTVTIEIPKIVENGASSSSATKDTLAPVSQQVTFDFLSDKFSAAQNEDSLSVCPSVNEDGSSFSRKRSFMRRITTRRRTVRTSMNTAHINRAQGYSKASGKHGHVLTAEEKLRMYTLKEIVNTEEEYVQLLQFIVEVIIPKLNECAKDIEIKCVSQDTVDKLLSNIEAIFKLHQKFFNALREATYPYPYHTHCIGNVFLKHKKEFHVYEQYCANYSNAQKLSYELEQDDKVKQLVAEWIQEVESKTRKLIHLECFLISPVQRLCKYPLFLREVAKYTNESHNDFKSVAEAKQMMEIVTKSVNEAERRKIIFEAIRDLEDANDSWEKNGAVAKQGFMTKRLHWWKGWNIYWFILDGYQLSHFCQPTDTKAAGRLELSSCKSLEEDATLSTGKPYSFGIETSDKTHYMYCTSEQEKQDWLNIFRWKLACIERSRKQSAKPIQTAIIASLSSMMNPTEQNSTPCKKNNNERILISSIKTEKHRNKFGRGSKKRKTKSKA